MDALLEKDLLPDWVIRMGIRRLNRMRLRDETAANVEEQQEKFNLLLEKMRSGPIAVHTQDANDQHYELPPRFFQLVLGSHLKYSSAYWHNGTNNLDDAEKHMLELTMQRADLKDGQEILELGCGWGSLTVEMAKTFPRARITAVSNSAPQREFIQERLRAAGAKNVKIITTDMNDLNIRKKFDRIVSVEMFEHMRNYELLFAKLEKLVRPGGKLFVHIFTHRELTYLYEAKDETDWMSRYFFTGGTMPGNHMLMRFCHPFRLEEHWLVSGNHYSRTAEAWLDNQDAHKDEIMELFRETYGADAAKKWFVYWRVFFMACSELFKTKNGGEWMVNHYRFTR